MRRTGLQMQAGRARVSFRGITASKHASQLLHSSMCAKLTSRQRTHSLGMVAMYKFEGMAIHLAIQKQVCCLFALCCPMHLDWISCRCSHHRPCAWRMRCMGWRGNPSCRVGLACTTAAILLVMEAMWCTYILRALNKLSERSYSDHRMASLTVRLHIRNKG